MIRVTIFTYRGDSPETIECLRCAKMAMPDAVFNVVDDACAPINCETIEMILAEGANYRQSIFQRGGNLNGAECVRGILTELTRDADPGDIIVKIDPDTAILDGEWLGELINGTTVYVSSGDDRIIVYGCTYAMRASAAIMVRDVARATDLRGSCPEDRTIANIVSDLFGCDHMTLHRAWTHEHPSGWTAFNWQSMLATPERYIREHNFSVVITGSPRHPEHPIQSRVECIRRLRLAKWPLPPASKFQDT